MGVFKPSTQSPSWVSFPFFFFFIIIILITTPSLANDNETRNPNNNSSSPPPFIQDTPNANANAYYTPFKPTIAVIVGVLTTMFSITFLLLLYFKHCKRENDVGHVNHSGLTPSATRKNSGINRGVIESLPIFRFGALRGQKDGLECAVCLTTFEPMEVLRLLPKCKHAFHIECVDTWLDGHSTCPLCRYRVDPEDIMLIQEDDANISAEKKIESEPELILKPDFRRVSGRHSSAGEFGSSSLNPTSFRRSLDVAILKKGVGESVADSVGCFERPRKDGLLLTAGMMADRKSLERRFEHRIIIGGFHHRWSDVHPSDLLYLRSEMLISDSHRFSSGSANRLQRQQTLEPLHTIISIDDGGGSGVINSRRVSEITGLSRFWNVGESNRTNINRNNHRQRHAGLVSRWSAWISSHSQSLPAVRTDINSVDLL